MELRHFRYFVAVAEEGSFLKAAGRLRVAQPTLSKQIHDLEAELGAALFERLPRGVRLTSAGTAFLVQARNTLDAAGRAVASARGAAADGAAHLQFAHGEMAVYTAMIEHLLATFRDAHPEARVRVSSKSDADTFQALREREVDVASVFIAEWPVVGFDALRLVDCATTGVLLPASHTLAARPSVRLAELQELTWLHSSLQRWPGFFRVIEDALQDRGLVPLRSRERPKEAPSANVHIAAGEAWRVRRSPLRTAPRRPRSSTAPSSSLRSPAGSRSSRSRRRRASSASLSTWRERCAVRWRTRRGPASPDQDRRCSGLKSGSPPARDRSRPGIAPSAPDCNIVGAPSPRCRMRRFLLPATTLLGVAPVPWFTGCHDTTAPPLGPLSLLV